MEEKKTSKLKKIIAITVFVVVVLFAIITSIVLNSYRKDLENLEDANDAITQDPPTDEGETAQIANFACKKWANSQNS